ncbi:ABC transporter permease subunit [Prosthecomicrobium pneumaticum]|uniref:Autoinducer 2 import system permease protein LsrD n=1 Tax=Prosthecomicrobium pneumaticum TaxID=81895 RepID=A0A7W9FKK4_9HYPH|nr:ribose transport system permease protein [Prosthecomicrobium pneumaticum]
MSRFLRRQGWVAGLFVLFLALLVVTRLIQPGYGAADFGSLARAVLPYAFAVAAQTVVVLAGGIDLSVAAMMALTSVTAAALMAGASEEFALAVVPFVLALGFALGAMNGALIVVSRVPDIVVTLATLFMLQGAALLVLDAPGGGAAEWLKALIVGTVPIPGLPGAVTDWIPKALVVLVICLAVVWIPLRRSRLGLSLYAIGSSDLAAFRSGVPVARTKILAYALGGLFAAMGGLTLTMSTGIGAPIPGPYLLASVAAVVLGGVALGGGRGGLLGPIIAVFVLRLVRTDLTLLAVDPNVTTIIEGVIMVVVVMLGALVAMRGRTP